MSALAGRADRVMRGGAQIRSTDSVLTGARERRTLESMVGRIAHIVVFAALTTCGGNVVQGTDGVDARAASGKDATARVNSGTRRDATSDGSRARLRRVTSPRPRWTRATRGQTPGSTRRAVSQAEKSTSAAPRAIRARPLASIVASRSITMKLAFGPAFNVA